MVAAGIALEPEPVTIDARAKVENEVESLVSDAEEGGSGWKFENLCLVSRGELGTPETKALQVHSDGVL